MTQSISNSNGSIKLTTKPLFKEQLTAYDAKKAIDKALQPAPAVAKVQQGLVPAPKAAKTSPAKKSGRVVGISADENKLLKNLLETVQEDANYSIISSSEAFAKLQGRYNK